MTTMNGSNGAQAGTTVRRGIGLAGRTALSWAVGGGMLLGGFLVAGMTLAGRMSGSGLLLASGGLFLIGGLLGFAHGAVLGYLGRPADERGTETLRRLGLAGLYAIPSLMLGWIVAGWIAITVVAVYAERWLALGAVGLAWLAGAGLVAAAGVNGWRSLRNGYGRWEHAGVGTLVVASLFGALLVLFVSERPELWGLHVRVTPVGAVLLAAAATLWLAGPMVTLALRYGARIPGLRPTGEAGGRRAVVNLGLGLAVGLGLGALAVPVYGALGLPGATGANVVELGLAAVSTAIVNEVLLRLFLVTAVAWLLLRRYEMGAGTAGMIAVGFAALTQVVLYLPGVAAAGFPSVTAAAAFLAATALVPALAFGALYWWRGFGAALVADATAVAALAILLV